jgi:hypothetical protein
MFQNRNAFFIVLCSVHNSRGLWSDISLGFFLKFVRGKVTSHLSFINTLSKSSINSFLILGTRNGVDMPSTRETRRRERARENVLSLNPVTTLYNTQFHTCEPERHSRPLHLLLPHPSEGFVRCRGPWPATKSGWVLPAVRDDSVRGRAWHLGLVASKIGAAGLQRTAAKIRGPALGGDFRRPSMRANG